jgi:hypothetical protein
MSCAKRYWQTVTVCNKNLYVEIFKIQPVDMCSDYFTDSVNFRIYIGKFDPANESFSFKCEGDSVYIEEVQFYETVGTTSYKRTNKVIEKKAVDLNELRKKKIFQ